MTLNRHVHMVRHPAIGMNTVRILAEPNFDQRFPAAPVVAIKKYGLTVVTAQDDVVQTARYVQSRFSGHGAAKELKATPRLAESP